MIVQTCDPATKTAGYALGDTSERWRGAGRVPLMRCRLECFGLERRLIRTDVAVVEAQYTGKISKQGISTLSFDAGFRLASMSADRYYSVTPRLWKTGLLGGYRFTKAVACARIRDNLTADEIEALKMIPAKHHPDVLDAIGMLWAWSEIEDQAKEFKR